MWSWQYDERGNNSTNITEWFYLVKRKYFQKHKNNTQKHKLLHRLILFVRLVRFFVFDTVWIRRLNGSNNSVWSTNFTIGRLQCTIISMPFGVITKGKHNVLACVSCVCVFAHVWVVFASLVYWTAWCTCTLYTWNVYSFFIKFTVGTHLYILTHIQMATATVYHATNNGYRWHSCVPSYWQWDETKVCAKYKE